MPSSRVRLSLWARVAAFLSFLAVLSALVAPASMLAEEVRTGKLGGICAVNSASWSGSADAGDAGNGNTPQAGSHCELCGASGLVLPPLPVVAIPCFPGNQLASVSLPAHSAGSIPGLPFSRGPPAL
ncbi:hypothetical protein D9M73_55860 [compost metagenome]